ncbi:MAG: hypothetical protein A2Y23_08575 [Clostridiales bacterium GWB2_37_7]|nr:MAG: hypothetical protein A2Y23_08575 [Clostridiales bacterium GWB2_37_7]
MSGGGIIAKQNTYLKSFKKAAATSPKTAKSLKKLGIAPDAVFERLEKAGVFVKTEDDKYYMDELKVQKFITKRANFARMILGAVVFTVITIYLINGWI